MCGESEVGGGCGVEIFVVEVLASTSAGDSGPKVLFPFRSIGDGTVSHSVDAIQQVFIEQTA
jgi:hypothetical protein